MDVPTLRQAALLAAWSSAALRGEVSAEHAMDVASASAAPVAVLAGDDEPLPFLVALGRWRAAGTSGWRYVPVAPGDAASLPGPTPFARRAIAGGAALVAVDGPQVALLMQPGAAAPIWATVPVDGRGAAPPESVAESDRRLLEAVNGSVEILESLDVAGGQLDLSGLLGSWHGDDPVPPGWSPRAERLASRSLRVLQVVALARQDAGGARSAREAGERERLLRELAGAARAAHATAWNEGLARTASAPRQL